MLDITNRVPLLGEVTGERPARGVPGPLYSHWSWHCHEGSVQIDPGWCRALDIASCDGSDAGDGCVAIEQWLKQIHPDDVELFRQSLIDAQLGHATRFDVEYRVLTRAHRWVWILHRAELASRDQRGEPSEYTGICIDVDQRREREQRARVNESRLQTALWGARAAFWQWHLPTDRRSESPLWFAMTGYSQEQWEQGDDPWRSHVHPADWPAVEQAMERFCQGGQDGLSYEYRFRVADGSWRWLLDRARAVEWDLDGKPALLMGVSLDIEPQKKVEAQLRESESRLQHALWGARVGMWEVLLPDDEVHWFDDWCERCGIEPCIGGQHTSRWRQRIHPEDAPEVQRCYEEHLAGRSESYDTEYRVLTTSGRWRWMMVRGRITERDAVGKPSRLIGICMDMGERQASPLPGMVVPPWAEIALGAGNAALWYWDVRANVDSYTDSYFRQLGFEPEEGRADLEFWRHRTHPDDYSRVLAMARAVAEGRASEYDVVYRMRHAAGYWLTVHEHARPLATAPDGSAPVMVGCVRMTGEGEGTPALRL